MRLCLPPSTCLPIVCPDQAKVGLLEEARGSLGDDAGDLAELPSIRLPTRVDHILKQADRLINEALLELHSSAPSAPLAALLAAPAPPCHSTESIHPSRSEDLDRFDAVSHGGQPAGKRAAYEERERSKVDWTLTGKPRTNRGLCGRFRP